ncbi:MAG: hypothetical protein C0506_13310 [Anaerolinea sp.]|nr:hypothetical protein [Anaerolinea sp.]
MNSEPRRLYHLALRELHAARGAEFAPSLGWSLPMHYGDPAAEYDAIRTRAAVLDRSHHSRFIVTGTDAMEVLKAVFAGHVDELEEGRAMRTVALDAEGVIRDVVLIARTGGIAYLVTGEPTQRFESLARMQAAVAADWDAALSDRTENTCLIGITGPAAGDVARTQLSEAFPVRMQLLHCAMFEFHGFRTLAMRTSDTGEDGFELMVAPAVAQHVIETLVAAGVPLAGHLAQEVARVEACVPAFVPDLETGLTPAEADLDVLLGIPGGHAHRILSALLVEGDPLDAGTRLTADGEPAGDVRSCLHSPGLNATIALGMIESRHALPGRELRAGAAAAHVVAKPFLRRRAAP